MWRRKMKLIERNLVINVGGTVLVFPANCACLEDAAVAA